MHSEALSYSNEYQHFIDSTAHSIIKRVYFCIDENPTFDKNIIPFNFMYCHSVRIVTETENFDIYTSMTMGSFETFWIVKSREHREISKYLDINSKIRKIEVENDKDNYAFKIKIEFEQNSLFIYCGEIRERGNSMLDYIVFDEMILVIDNEKDAKKFENMVYESKILYRRMSDNIFLSGWFVIHKFYIHLKRRLRTVFSNR